MVLKNLLTQKSLFRGDQSNKVDLVPSICEALVETDSLEILDIILSYSGHKKNRNGKYMNQIYKTDHRYKILDEHFTLYKRKIYDSSIIFNISKCRPFMKIYIFIKEDYIFYHYERKYNDTRSYFLR